jgi:methylthioribose-1-phosphate isomerase (EC 5.3.1.23)
MKREKVDAIFVGADRIARNGDIANKIGTYMLAVLAKEHRIPFYVVAPTSSIDPTIESGEEIRIEERSKKEVIFVGEKQIAPEEVDVLNYAFDVTPWEFISAIITEDGIFYPPYTFNQKD